MRVLQVCHEFPPEIIGGIATHTASLARALSELKVECRVATIPTSTSLDMPEGVYYSTALRYRPPREWSQVELDLLLHQACKQATQGSAVHIVHCQESKSWPAAETIAASLGVPLVCTVHSTELGRRNGRMSETHRFQEDQRLRMVRASAVSIVVSDAVRQGLQEHGIPGERLHTIRTGIHDIPSVAPYTARRRGTVCFLGRMEYEKGADLIGPIVRRLEGQGIHAEFVLIGDGRLRAEIARALESQIGNERLRILGFVPHDVALSTLASCSILAMPSRYDSYPMSMLEAARLGIPVVAFDVGGIREFVEDDVSGLLVEPQNVERFCENLSNLITDQDRLRRLGSAARERFMKHGSDREMATQTLALYEKVVRAY